MSIFAEDAATRTTLQEAELREQQEAFRNDMGRMDAWDPLPPYRPHSPSPPNAKKILQEIEDVALDDPEMLQKLKAIARKLPTPIISAADRESVVNRGACLGTTYLVWS